METIEEIGHKAYNEAFNNDWGRDIAEFARLYAEFGATEQKAIDDAELAEVKKQRDAYYDELLRLRQERATLIEKVIWLIENSYPDTYEWGHDELVRNINEDFLRRAKELNEMFEQQ